MPNDAKLGLVFGTGLVIIIAVVFFRKDAANAQTEPASATTVKNGILPTVSSRTDAAGSPAQAVAGTRTVLGRSLKHTVKEGDSLFSLAQAYYQDRGRFVDIYQANESLLRTPDHLEAGTVLIIPDLPE